MDPENDPVESDTSGNDTNSEQKPEPKIIVDEDWKSQVEREKVELRDSKTAAQAGSGSESSEKEPIQNDGPSELPPASFMILVPTLATQAMAGLGILPDPITGQPNVNRPLAKHFIDMLVMLEEKTKGNLTDEEAAQIRDGLHQLRMIYLAAPATMAENPTEPTQSSLELP